MQGLDEPQRREFSTLAVLLCAIAVVLAPIAGRTANEVALERAAFAGRFTPPPPVSRMPETRIAIVRDPFASLGTETPVRSDLDDIPALPANTGAAGTPLFDTGEKPTVQAIVTSARARSALVQSGDGIRVVRVGDALAGSRVAEIAAGGIRLTNGVFLAFPGLRP